MRLHFLLERQQLIKNSYIYITRFALVYTAINHIEYANPDILIHLEWLHWNFKMRSLIKDGCEKTYTKPMYFYQWDS